ncbi:signal-transducing histidine kinase [Salinarchaeum sp. Harcht-Bsk1]|uniref:sensor histidine kinase n=1 Tax=Salinarchaeum sp. Harcht-Bsk1 TaxID=1333523 RepID=UPI0003424859|nr:PAS domain-containing sensor histidine kinase [Salinarchaeum sp. Harcht-Bsk1]AGN00747.1 signal-transducing histidine kinase [Salinarchaeum sp. Harcht-Bsk1]
MTAQRETAANALDAERFRHLFEHVQDAIVDFEFVDDEPIIREVNDAFVDLFGYESPAIIGESLNDLIVPSWLAGESDEFDERTASGEHNHAVVDRQTKNGVKTVLYRGVPYADGDRGLAIYTDLTDEIRQERQLAVLNRVLRHNLRNEVNVLAGNAEELLETADSPAIEAAAETIRDSALTLSRLGDEARDIERVLDADPDLEPTELGPVVAAARDAVPLTERATVAVDVADAPPALTGGHLDRAIAALLDNAVRHSEAPTPCVAISASASADRVGLTVADDGPGLPERERRLLTGDLELTPLDHGNGLGLWLVRWIVTAYGGSVEYTDRPNGGSAITLWVAAA